MGRPLWASEWRFIQLVRADERRWRDDFASDHFDEIPIAIENPEKEREGNEAMKQTNSLAAMLAKAKAQKPAAQTMVPSSDSTPDLELPKLATPAPIAKPEIIPPKVESKAEEPVAEDADTDPAEELEDDKSEISSLAGTEFNPSDAIDEDAPILQQLAALTDSVPDSLKIKLGVELNRSAEEFVELCNNLDTLMQAAYQIQAGTGSKPEFILAEVRQYVSAIAKDLKSNPIYDGLIKDRDVHNIMTFIADSQQAAIESNTKKHAKATEKASGIKTSTSGKKLKLASTGKLGLTLDPKALSGLKL